ncbi:MAG: pirin family protein [Comamonadaceae bacterium]|nr:MAG: pirin family protein [Comamonadaceae bacterium]
MSPTMFTLEPHTKDLGGGFQVRRVLPAAQRRAVGPFVFFDHFGPATEKPGDQHDVRPHPHIGLATVTYLFEGAMMHRDSLGTEQEIRPGAVNWMTAGKGIVHSERKPEALKTETYVNHGLQLWCALPREFEEVEPTFWHSAAQDIPALDVQGVAVRVLVGEAFGVRSPVPTLMPTLYVDVALPAGIPFDLPPLAPEMAVYAVDGELQIGGITLAQHTMAVLPDGGTEPVRIESAQARRFVVVGGAPLDGPRFMSWNFVSSRRERILQAGEDWEAQRMGQVPGETEFIPLPDHPFKTQRSTSAVAPDPSTPQG